MRGHHVTSMTTLSPPLAHFTTADFREQKCAQTSHTSLTGRGAPPNKVGEWRVSSSPGHQLSVQRCARNPSRSGRAPGAAAHALGAHSLGQTVQSPGPQALKEQAAFACSELKMSRMDSK